MSIIDSLAEAAEARTQSAVERKAIVAGSLIPPRLAGKAMQKTDAWSLEHAAKNGYEASSLVYRVATSIAAGVASVRWFIAEARGGGRVEVLDEHPLVDLLRRPRAVAESDSGQEIRVSGQQELEAFTLNLVLTGNGILRKVLGGQAERGAPLPPVAELWNAAPDPFSPVIGSDGLVDGWRFKAEGKDVPFAAEEILHVMLCNPRDPFWGLSPLKAAAQGVDTHTLAVEWNRVSFENRTVGSMVFTYKGEAPLNPTQREQLATEIREQHTERPHAPWISSGNLEVHELSRTPVEMDFVAGLKLTREQVLSAFGMPPVVAGFFDNATLANADSSRRIFWEDYLIPIWLDRLKAAFQAQLVPHFGDPDRLKIDYSLSGVPALLPALVEKGKALSLLTRNGVPFNEAVRECALPFSDVDGGDEPYGHLPEARRAIPDGTTRPAVKVIDVTPRRLPETKAHAEAASEHLRSVISAGESAVLEIARAQLLRGSVRDRDAALEAIKAGEVDRLLEVMGIDTAILGLQAIVEPLVEAAHSAARSEGAEIARQTETEFTSDLAPVAVQARTRVDGVVADMLQSSRTGTLALIEAGNELDLPGTSVLSLLASAALLNSMQALSVRKFLRQMVGGEVPVDRAVGQAIKLADTMALERARLVAGHEASWVVHNVGQEAAWNQARAAGVVDTGIQTWFDADDARVCPICFSLDGQEVPLGEQFFSAVSGVSYAAPPAHGECRCGRVIVLER